MFLKLRKSEAKSYGTLLYKNWVQKLTKNEKLSLRKYKGVLIFSNYKKVNSALRNSNEKSCLSDIVNISNAINKSIIDKNIECIRNSSVKFLEANGFTIDSIKPNDILVEKGFMSTYLFKPKLRCTAKVVLFIKVHKGTCGAYINNILPWWSFNKSEYEIIFNKNTRLKVIKKTTFKKRVELAVEMLQHY